MEQMLLRYAKVKCHIKKYLFFEIRIKMINFDDYVNGIVFSENNRVALNGIVFKTKHNKNWPYIPDHLYRILIKIYLYAKDPYESKYQYLFNKRECVVINHFSDPKAFIKYSNDMHDVYKILIITIPIKKIRH